MLTLSEGSRIPLSLPVGGQGAGVQGHAARPMIHASHDWDMNPKMLFRDLLSSIENAQDPFPDNVRAIDYAEGQQGNGNVPLDKLLTPQREMLGHSSPTQRCLDINGQESEASYTWSSEGWQDSRTTWRLGS